MDDLTFIIDRIDGKFAVLTRDDLRIDWPVALLPEGSGEGSAILVTIRPTTVATPAPRKSDTTGDIEL